MRMGVVPAIRTIAPREAAEILGPAEGQQYQTIVDIMETNSPPTANPCYDVFTFDIAAESDVCITLTSTAGPLAAGVMYPRLYDFVQCTGYGAGTQLVAGQTEAGFCVGPLAAGSYSIFISGEGITPPVPYSVQISADTVISQPVREHNEDCQVAYGCE